MRLLAFFILVSSFATQASAIEKDRLGNLIDYLVDVKDGRDVKEPNDKMTKLFQANLGEKSDSYKDFLAIQYHLGKRYVVLARAYQAGVDKFVFANGKPGEREFEGRILLEVGLRLDPLEIEKLIAKGGLRSREGKAYVVTLLEALEDKVEEIGGDSIENWEFLRYAEIEDDGVIMTNSFALDTNVTKKQLDKFFRELLDII